MRKRSSKQIFAETLLEISKRKTIDKITVQQIVEESGLSLQTFYNHFRDKADLVLWIHKSKFDELLEKLGKNGYTYRDLTLENSRFYVEHKDYMWNALNHTHGQDNYWRASSENAYRVLRAYILRQHSLPDLPVDINFYLKVYCFAAPYIYAECAFNMENTPPEVFAEYAEGAMPEPLKKYLL
ncbi:MAG: TetR family transcriptional regulator [Clostridia bacterium]|nr:TetR family transcriptional regulator [Clostridia bacterium]